MFDEFLMPMETPTAFLIDEFESLGEQFDSQSHDPCDALCVTITSRMDELSAILNERGVEVEW